MDPIEDALTDATALIEWLRLPGTKDTINRVSAIISDTFDRGGRILTCGNGGSMCDAMHFAEELSGRFRQDRRALAAQAIADPAHLTCVANDWSFDHVFARGVEAFGRRDDVLIAFSTSGNSPNIIAAAKAAAANGLRTVGMLGRDGGIVCELCEIALVVPARTSDRIQEAHIKIVHILIELVERRLFPENYGSQRPSASIA